VSQASTEVGQLDKVELRIPARPEWVVVARLTVAAIANRLPFTIEDIEDLKLAIAEACTYVIAAGGDFIDIVCETSPDFVRIRVRDLGTIKPEAASKHLSGASTEGLGIFLIQALMDEVEHTPPDDSSGELIMTKRISA
jgi:serine/threonine-protein kinase RsbW